MRKESPKQYSSNLEEKRLSGLPLPIEEWLIKKQVRDYLSYIDHDIRICIYLLSGIIVLGAIVLIHFW